jgi:hypothetical protein
VLVVVEVVAAVVANAVVVGGVLVVDGDVVPVGAGGGPGNTVP